MFLVIYNLLAACWLKIIGLGPADWSCFDYVSGVLIYVAGMWMGVAVSLCNNVNCNYVIRFIIVCSGIDNLSKSNKVVLLLDPIESSNGQWSNSNINTNHILLSILFLEYCKILISTFNLFQIVFDDVPCAKLKRWGYVSPGRWLGPGCGSATVQTLYEDHNSDQWWYHQLR